jgi:hypothetical protein
MSSHHLFVWVALLLVLLICSKGSQALDAKEEEALKCCEKIASEEFRNCSYAGMEKMWDDELAEFEESGSTDAKEYFTKLAPAWLLPANVTQYEKELEMCTGKGEDASKCCADKGVPK